METFLIFTRAAPICFRCEDESVVVFFAIFIILKFNALFFKGGLHLSCILISYFSILFQPSFYHKNKTFFFLKRQLISDFSWTKNRARFVTRAKIMVIKYPLYSRDIFNNIHKWMYRTHTGSLSSYTNCMKSHSRLNCKSHVQILRRNIDEITR